MEEPPRAGAPLHKALVVTTVIALGAAAAFAILWARDREPAPEDVTAYMSRQRAGVAETAAGAIEGLMNYDADSIEERRAELEPLLTSSLREQYDEIITGGLDRALQDTGATAEAEVVSGPDVSFVSSQRAEAVARIIQEVALEPDGAPRTGFYVLRLTLLQEGDAWRVDRFEVLSQQIAN